MIFAKSKPPKTVCLSGGRLVKTSLQKRRQAQTSNEQEPNGVASCFIQRLHLRIAKLFAIIENVIFPFSQKENFERNTSRNFGIKKRNLFIHLNEKQKFIFSLRVILLVYRRLLSF